MLQALVDFFYSLFDAELPGGNLLSDIQVVFNSTKIIYPGGNNAMPLDMYLTMICSYIALFFIIILCCLFVYKIIKLIGGLIR